MKKTAIISGLLLYSLAGAETLADSLGAGVCAFPADVVEGRVPGLRVSDRVSGDINCSRTAGIRGINSIRLSGEPLWVIDGVVSEVSLDGYSLPFNAEDIGSIEVIKDISRTSAYGIRGANGVVVIRTKHPSSEGFHATLKSSASLWNGRVGSSDILSAGGATGKASYYISGYYNSLSGEVGGNRGRSGGLRASFETKSNSVVWFGMNTFLAMDSTSSPVEESWSGDYDNDSDGRKISAGTYLVINILPSLHLRADAGIDYNDRTRYVWNGPATPQGSVCNGLAVVSDHSLMNYNASAELAWKRYVARDHELEFGGRLDVFGRNSRDNTLEGRDFLSYDLRAKGINVAGSKPEIRKFDHSHSSRAGSLSARYSWRDAAGIEGRLRWDRTPRYQDSGQNYRSLNAFFDLTDAFPGISGKLLSGLRLSAGYGEAGDERYVPYGNYGTVLGAFPTVGKEFEMFYDGLCRLYSAEWNASLDASLLSGRLDLKTGVYDRRTADSFTGYCFGAPQSEASHYWEYSDPQEQFKRKSILSNKGIEILARIGIIRKAGLDWSVSFTASRNFNRVESVDPYDETGADIHDITAGCANVNGRQALSFHGFETNGDLTLRDITGDGRIDESDQVVLGASVPDFNASVGTTVNAGRFSFLLLATAATGHKMADPDKLLSYGMQMNESCLLKGDNLNLRRAAASYTLPTGGIKRLESVTFCLSGENIFRIGECRRLLFAPSVYTVSVKLDF